MMGRVMDRIVANVSETKASRDRRSKTSQGEREKQIKDDSERNADDRRHDQPGSIVRIIVMNSVDDKVEKFTKARLRLVMEDITMNDVLEQSPDEDSDNEKS